MPRQLIQRFDMLRQQEYDALGAPMLNMFQQSTPERVPRQCLRDGCS